MQNNSYFDDWDHFDEWYSKIPPFDDGRFNFDRDPEINKETKLTINGISYGIYTWRYKCLKSEWARRRISDYEIHYLYSVEVAGTLFFCYLRFFQKPNYYFNRPHFLYKILCAFNACLIDEIKNRFMGNEFDISNEECDKILNQMNITKDLE